MSNPMMIFTIRYTRTSKGVATVRAGSISDAMDALRIGDDARVIEDEETSFILGINDDTEFDVRPMSRRERFDLIAAIYELPCPESTDESFADRHLLLIEDAHDDGMCWSAHLTIFAATKAIDSDCTTICLVDLDTGTTYDPIVTRTVDWEIAR